MLRELLFLFSSFVLFVILFKYDDNALMKTCAHMSVHVRVMCAHRLILGIHTPTKVYPRMMSHMVGHSRMKYVHVIYIYTAFFNSSSSDMYLGIHAQYTCVWRKVYEENDVNRNIYVILRIVIVQTQLQITPVTRLTYMWMRTWKLITRHRRMAMRVCMHKRQITIVESAQKKM